MCLTPLKFAISGRRAGWPAGNLEQNMINFPSIRRIFRLQRIVLPCLAVCFLAASARADALDPDHPPLGATPKEISTGDKAAVQLEKDPKVKILKPDTPEHKALIDKLNGMIKELGDASARPQIHYTVKVIEDKDINSFTLPNGHIYIYQGLLDYLHSDDEVAAVLAHEIGHNARMHALRGEAKAKPLNWMSLASLAAMLAGGYNGANIGAFSQYLLQGVMNGYSVGYEKEADAAAVRELAKTHYNPSAMVTVMDRLNDEELHHPEVRLGIFETHPPSEERAAAAMAEILAMGLPFNPDDVHGGHEAAVVVKSDRVQVVFDSITLAEFAAGSNPAEAKQRAEKLAASFNNLRNANVQMHDFSVDESTGTPRLMARDQELAIATPDDAKLANLTQSDCAQKWLQNFRRLFWRQVINGPL